MEELRRPCCILGYHVYSTVWEAAIGEELVCNGSPTMHKIVKLKAFRVFIVFGMYKKCFLNSKNYPNYYSIKESSIK